MIMSIVINDNFVEIRGRYKDNQMDEELIQCYVEIDNISHIIPRINKLWDNLLKIYNYHYEVLFYLKNGNCVKIGFGAKEEFEIFKTKYIKPLMIVISKKKNDLSLIHHELNEIREMLKYMVGSYEFTLAKDDFDKHT